jgi:hypothetical protein
MQTIQLVLLASDSNEKGDLLTRLMEDLFHCLGYGNCRFNAAKPGREIDVSADHRYENKKIIAECKATKAPIGGAHISKFVGVLDAECRSSPDTSIAGYFISLGGFTESAIAQENAFIPARVVLLDAQQIVSEVVRGGIVAPVQQAVEVSTRLLERQGINDPIDENGMLIGYRGGWAWVVFAERNHQRTYVSIVHADGRLLAPEVCQVIRELAADKYPDISRLPLVNDWLDTTSSLGDVAKRDYASFLLKEYDVITLDGLPIDHEMGSQKFSLNDLYVNLSLADMEGRYGETNDQLAESDDEHEHAPVRRKSKSIREVLSLYPRVAILGAPGAGKTTLLKRLAVTYATSISERKVTDLPAEDWFPLVIRCRQLGSSAAAPIMEIVAGLAARAEMPQLASHFQEAIRQMLRSGNLLLLVDGLDEIATPSNRQAFVAQLRTFLAIYPTVRMVLTSRETGYRIVASSVLSFSQAFRVAPLSRKAIRELTKLWHRHVIGPSAGVEAEAEALAEAIVSTDRILSPGDQSAVTYNTAIGKAVGRSIAKAPKRSVCQSDRSSVDDLEC